KNFKRQLQSLVDGQGLGFTKELRTARAVATDVRGLGSPAQLGHGRTDRGKNQKGLVADNRIVALDLVLVVRVVPMPFLKRNVTAPRALVAVPIIFRKPDAPAIAHFAPIGLCLFR